MANFDDFKLSIEAMSGGKNTVLFDDMGMPSVMVPIPKMKISDLIDGGSENVHPGFIVNGVEKDVMYVGKFQSIVMNDRAYSLPMRDPQASVNFNNSLAYCRNKGNGWCLVPYSLWCAIALWCRKNETMPHGNNYYGQDRTYTHEKGVPVTYGTDGSIYHCLTGSGPATWYHNWMPDGIADLNGNVTEWVAGLRVQDGELQFIPYANAFDQEISMLADSTAWKAMLADGSLVDPGASGTLKWDYASSKVTLTDGDITYTEDASMSSSYASMGLAGSLTADNVPELAKALLLYPDEPGGDYGGDYHYIDVIGERLPYCGGNYANGATAGVFCVSLSYARSYVAVNRGFRSAYCDL